MLISNLSMHHRKPAPPASNSTYPVPTIYSVPSDNPFSQSGMETFSPTMSGTPSDSAPVLSMVTLTGKADRCIWVTGDQFDSSLALTAYGECSNGSSGFVACTLLYRTGNRALFALPASIPSRAFILVWPTTSSGTGRPLAINAPEPRSVNASTWGSFACIPSATVYMGGVNLCNDDASPLAWIYLQPEFGSGHFATVTACDAGLITFTAPDSVTGDYEAYDVWVHNGRGGAYGWRQSIRPLIVCTPLYWSRDYTATILTLKDFTDTYGGGANSGSSMLTAWNAMIATVPNGTQNGPGITITLEAGTYLADANLETAIGWGRGVRIVGAGKALTTLNLGGHALNFSTPTGCFAEDMTIIGSSIGCNLKNIKIQGVGIDAAPSFPGGPSHFILDGCDFEGGSNGGAVAYFGFLQDSMIRNCTFKLAGLPESAIWCFFGGYNVLIKDCHTQDYGMTGTERGAGRFLVMSFNADRFTIHNCVTTDMQVYGDQNRGEQILGDGGSVQWTSAVSSATSTSVTIDATGITLDYTRRKLFVVSGKGEGQYARITGLTSGGGNNTYALDRSLVVVPDTSSIVYICDGVGDLTISKCTLDGDGNNQGASCGFEMFGPTAGAHFFDNIVSDVNYAYVDWALDQANSHGAAGCPSIWNLIRDNTFTGTYWGPRIYGCGIFEGHEIGNAFSVHRDSTFSGIKGTRDTWLQFKQETMTCFDHLTISGDGQIGLSMNAQIQGGLLVLYKSSISLGSGTFSGSSEINLAYVLDTPATILQIPSSGQFHGFESSYTVG